MVKTLPARQIAIVEQMLKRMDELEEGLTTVNLYEFGCQRGKHMKLRYFSS
jgi:hypothetical protein